MKALGTFLMAILGLLAIPIMLFNFITPIAAGIWLGNLGEWNLLGAGLVYMFAGTFFISIALLPALALGGAAMAVHQRGSAFLAYILSAPALLWTLFLAGGSCAYAIYFASSIVDHEGSIVPYVLWAIAAATAPWDYMAMKETQAQGEPSDSAVTASFLNIGCVISFFGVWLYDRTELTEIALPIGICLALAQVLNFSYLIARMQERQTFDF